MTVTILIPLSTSTHSLIHSLQHVCFACLLCSARSSERHSTLWCRHWWLAPLHHSCRGTSSGCGELSSGPPPGGGGLNTVV